MIVRPLAVALGAVLAFLSPAAAQSCTGDCDSGGNVTVDEVVTGVSIALGSRSIDECPNFDSTGDQGVTVDEILQAINFALDGCAPAPTPTPTPPLGTPTRTPTETPPAEPGPLVSFFGLAGASNNLLPVIGTDGEGRPMYQPTCRNGFFIVVEGRPNANTGNIVVGRRTFNSDPANASVRPDLQILADRDLGNGSTLICDHRGEMNAQPPFGGIPGNLLDFNPSSQRVADALNDIGCRFVANTTADPCTKNALGNASFVHPLSTVQFCNQATVDGFWAVPLGDTIFAVQLRDFNGTIGQRREIVVRVVNDCPPGL
jgi:hypothetical protein